MTRAEYNAQRTEMLVWRLTAPTVAAFDRVQQAITVLDAWSPDYAADPHGLLDHEDDETEVAA